MEETKAQHSHLKSPAAAAAAAALEVDTTTAADQPKNEPAEGDATNTKTVQFDVPSTTAHDDPKQQNTDPPFSPDASEDLSPAAFADNSPPSLRTSRMLQFRNEGQARQSVHKLVDPCDACSRQKDRNNNVLNRLFGLQEDEDDDDDDNVQQEDNNPLEAGTRTAVKQYRIRSKSTSQISLFWESSSGAVGRAMGQFLHWSFHASFLAVAVASFLIFLFLVIVFALFAYGNGRYQPGCINFTQNAKRSEYFMDAFQLSWTTLSTVGYGLIAPSVATSETRCLGINVLMAVEAFTGVLFAGVIGAIIFSKVAKVQSIAQIIFSHPICVRYGTGVMDRNDDDDDEEDDDPDDGQVQFPCPTLEFRMINLLSNEKGGEIIDASISVVAAVEKGDDEVSASTRASKAQRKKNIVGKAANVAMVVGKIGAKAAMKSTEAVGKVGTKAAKAGTGAAVTTGAALFGAGRKATTMTGTIIQQLNRQLVGSPKGGAYPTGEGSVPFNEKELEKRLEKEFEKKFVAKLEQEQKAMGGVSLLEQTRIDAVLVDEGNSTLAPPRVYHKLEMETDRHPFFKRVWVGRHVLDAKSPLLSRKARELIRKNNGFWPESLNDHKAVREHLAFSQIVVSFCGTSNVNCSSVHAQKLYDYVDVNIGYSFANVLAKDRRSKLIVDPVLIHDVIEQIGGGGEPLNPEEDRESATPAGSSVRGGDAATIGVPDGSAEGRAMSENKSAENAKAEASGGSASDAKLVASPGDSKVAAGEDK